MRSLALDLLRALAAQDARSPHELAAACDARVAEVERCLARLEGSGLATLENGAARLAAPFDFLDAAHIAAELGPLAAGLRVDVVDACPSTSSALLAEAPDGRRAAAAGRRGAARRAGPSRPALAVVRRRGADHVAAAPVPPRAARARRPAAGGRRRHRARPARPGRSGRRAQVAQRSAGARWQDRRHPDRDPGRRRRR